MKPTPRIRRPPPSPIRSKSGLLHRKVKAAVRSAGLGFEAEKEPVRAKP